MFEIREEGAILKTRLEPCTMWKWTNGWTKGINQGYLYAYAYPIVCQDDILTYVMAHVHEIYNTTHTLFQLSLPFPPNPHIYVTSQ